MPANVGNKDPGATESPKTVHLGHVAGRKDVDFRLNQVRAHLGYQFMADLGNVTHLISFLFWFPDILNSTIRTKAFAYSGSNTTALAVVDVPGTVQKRAALWGLVLFADNPVSVSSFFVVYNVHNVTTFPSDISVQA